MDFNYLNKKSDQEKFVNKEENLLDCLSMFNLSGLNKKRNYIKEYILYDSLNESKMKNLKVKAEILFNESEEKNTCYFMLGCKDTDNINSEQNGLEKNEIELSLKAMSIICEELEAKFDIINEIYIGKKIVLEIKVERLNSKLELRMGMFGEECSGKSTLIGVLVNGNLDDGNGSARSNIFRFQHEHNTGKTSNLSHYVSI